MGLLVGQEALGGKRSEGRQLPNPLGTSPCPAETMAGFRASQGTKQGLVSRCEGLLHGRRRRWWGGGLSCKPAPSVIAACSLALGTSRPSLPQPSCFQEMASLDHG